MQPGRGCGNSLISTTSLRTASLAGIFAVSTAFASDPGPLAEIGRFEAAPVIDGRGGDACWKDSVSIGDFQHFGSLRPVTEGGSVCRIGYDDEAIYFLLECDEPYFQTAMQKSDEIGAEGKPDTKDLILDDSFMIMLRRPGEEEAFEWIVNTRGVLSDARTSSTDLWKERDLAWDSGARSAAHIEEGRWSAELAIPWGKIGGKPATGEPLEALLTRLSWSRNSQSSWHPTEARGAHAPQAWGTLRLVESVPSLSYIAPHGALNPGNNRIEARVASAGDKAYFLVAEVQSDSPVRASEKITPGPEAKPEAVTLDLTGQKGEVKFSWSLLDAVTLEPIYRSPIIRKFVEVSTVTLHLSTEKGFRLFVNGDLVKSGTGSLETEIPLHTGVNLLAVEAESGRVELRLEGTQIPQDQLRWRSGNPAAEGAFSPATDDSSWPLAPQVPGTDGAQRVGEPGKPRVFRHTLLAKETKVWPLRLPAYYIAGSGSIFFSSLGIKNKPLNGWKLFLETPPDIQVIGVSGFDGDRNGKRIRNKARFTLRKMEDKGQYVVEADRPILFDPRLTSIQRIFEVILRHDKESPDPDKTHNLRYSALANQGTVSELGQTIPIRLLPAPNGRQPKKFGWKIWGGAFWRLDDHGAFRTAILQLAAAAGANEFHGGDKWTAQAAHEFGFKDFMKIEFAPWSVDLTAFLVAHPQLRRITAAGKPSDSHMCLSAMLDDGWEGVREAIHRQVAPVAPDIVEFDYEYPPLTGRQTCYCDRCLAAFREAAGLPESTPLSPEIIKEKHANAWVDFMARRIARLLRKMKETINKDLPGHPKLAVYSGYQTAKNPAQYGINWRYVGDLQAVDIAGCGYGRSPEILQATRAALQGIPFMCGVLLNPYLGVWTLNTDVPVVPLTKALLLRRALDGPGGVLIYERKLLDGRSWTALGKVTCLTADYEEQFLTSELESLPGHDPAIVQILKGKDEDLLCVMNPTNAVQKHQIAVPAEYATVRDYYQGREGEPIAPAKTVTPTLPPGEIAVYILHRQ